MNKKQKYSQISRRIFAQYIVAYLVMLVILFGGFFGAWYLCTRKIWQPEDRLYQLFKVLQALSPYFVVLVIAVVPFLFTYVAIRRPLRYLDDVIGAAKSLSGRLEEAIELPAELVEAQNELNQARELALRNMQLAKEAEQRKNDLIVYLAHDLKTPLTSVIGYLHLLVDEPQISAELRARYTGIALDKAQRLEELINEFFDITRFNLTTLALEREQTNLTRMLEQIASEFAPVLAEKDLTIQTQLAQNIEIVCDRDKLSRVFDNLLRNAVNYSYPESEICLSMEWCDGTVRILVRNRGKTIPPQKLSRIFEQFFRMDSARTSSTGGSGLGLAIAKEIVEQHGGQIFAESADETITLVVLLPDGMNG